MADRVELGSKWGRWTVVQYASPGKRPGDSYQRPRVLVECVCGRRQMVFEIDLKPSPSTGRARTAGCRSMRCHYEWKIRREITDELIKTLQGKGGSDG